MVSPTSETKPQHDFQKRETIDLNVKLYKPNKFNRRKSNIKTKPNKKFNNLVFNHFTFRSFGQPRKGEGADSVDRWKHDKYEMIYGNSNPNVFSFKFSNLFF